MSVHVLLSSPGREIRTFASISHLKVNRWSRNQADTKVWTIMIKVFQERRLVNIPCYQHIQITSSPAWSPRPLPHPIYLFTNVFTSKCLPKYQTSSEPGLKSAVETSSEPKSNTSRKHWCSSLSRGRAARPQLIQYRQFKPNEMILLWDKARKKQSH